METIKIDTSIALRIVNAAMQDDHIAYCEWETI